MKFIVPHIDRQINNSLPLWHQAPKRKCGAAGSLGVAIVLLLFFFIVLLFSFLLSLFRILGVPFRKWIIKSGELTVGIGRKAKMRLDLYDVPTVLIGLGGHCLAHAKDALKDPLDQ
jgi:hypothetical protein